jgi:hypothetical protein
VNTVGCSVDSGQQGSIFKSFNRNVGGIVVMEWKPNFIKFWFTPRVLSGNMGAFKGFGPISPGDVRSLGMPDAVFRGCDFEREFARHFIIISTNFCGDWGRFS